MADPQNMTIKEKIAWLRKRKNRFVERQRALIALRIEKADKRIARLKKQREQQQEEAAGKAFRMFDSINLATIPASAGAVAGYVNGYWPTYNSVVAKWPKAKHLSIAVTSSANAECLDVEPGDATPADAPAWFRRQVQNGVKRPVIYTGLSQARTVIDTLAKAGIPRSAYRLWTAHYTYEAHRCSPECGFNLNTTADATQFTNKSNGVLDALDESLCAGDFL